MEFYERHPLLAREELQYVPHGDGKRFEPALKLALLVLDQSHFIAERFEIATFQEQVFR
jgi:hypothetical protein